MHKKCGVCGKEFGKDEYRYPMAGGRKMCEECWNEYDIEYVITNSDKNSELEEDIEKDVFCKDKKRGVWIKVIIWLLCAIGFSVVIIAVTYTNTIVGNIATGLLFAGIFGVARFLVRLCDL